MAKLLVGTELAGFIKEKQAKQVRGLRQAHNIFPKLAIIQTIDDPVIESYVGYKQRYGQDILIEVEHHKVNQKDAPALIKKLNSDKAVHGIILQLPLADKSQTDELCNLVDLQKDVDGLTEGTKFLSATPTAILWLLAGYGIELAGKKIVIVGRGKLVGGPLALAMQNSGLTPEIVHSQTKSPEDIISTADILITAVGKPGLIKTKDIKPGAVVIDAGTASDKGVLKGDVEESALQRDDISITPTKGGLGPLTIAALFDNLINAATATQNK